MKRATDHVAEDATGLVPPPEPWKAKAIVTGIISLILIGASIWLLVSGLDALGILPDAAPVTSIGGGAS